MPETKRGQKRKMQDAAEEALGGKWKINRWNTEKIEMTNTEETEHSRDRQSIWDEAINLCRMRIALKTFAEHIRDNVDQRVRWDCVEGVWVWLTTTLAICNALVQNTLPVAWCSMLAAFSLMTDASLAGSEWVTVDAQRQGELWIHVGLDGVPLWISHVVACTICQRSRLKTLPMQSPQRHFVFCLLRGTDSIGVVNDMLAQCKIIEDVGMHSTTTPSDALRLCHPHLTHLQKTIAKNTLFASIASTIS